jgi:hypothetical protein
VALLSSDERQFVSQLSQAFAQIGRYIESAGPIEWNGSTIVPTVVGEDNLHLSNFTLAGLRMFIQRFNEPARTHAERAVMVAEHPFGELVHFATVTTVEEGEALDGIVAKKRRMMDSIGAEAIDFVAAGAPAIPQAIPGQANRAYLNPFLDQDAFMARRPCIGHQELQAYYTLLQKASGRCRSTVVNINFEASGNESILPSKEWQNRNTIDNVTMLHTVWSDAPVAMGSMVESLLFGYGELAYREDGTNPYRPGIRRPMNNPLLLCEGPRGMMLHKYAQPPTMFEL